MDDQKIINALEKSPLQEKDKQHWKNLLDRMSMEQKQRFYHTIVVKTDIKRASEEIKTALDIINQALEEEQAAKGPSVSQPPSQTPPSAVQEAMQQTNIKEHVPEHQVDDPEAIEQKHQEAEQKLKELRGELAQISQEVSGEKPPSYQ